MESVDATSSRAIAAPDSGSGLASRIGRVAVPTALFIYTLCVFVPWTLLLPPDDLDASWAVALHWAYVHHLDFGHELIFTYGPWGFVVIRHLPATFGWVVAAWTVIGTGFFAAIWKISRGLPSRAVGAAWAALMITVAGAPIGQFEDVRMAVLSGMLLVVHFYVDDRPWAAGKVILSAGMAWTSLIKFSATFFCLPVLVVISLDQLLRRRAPSMLIVYVAGYLGLWLLAGQSLGSLGPYLEHSWNIASGYGDGEALITASENIDILLYAAAGGMLLAMAVLLLPWRGGILELRKRGLGAAGLGGVLLALFKTGYVRHDLHELIATASMTLIALAVGAAVWPKTRGMLAKGVILATCVGSLCLTSNSGTVALRTSEPMFMLQSLEQIPGSLKTAIGWGLGTTSFQNEYADMRKAVPAGLKSEIVGSVDSYSTGQHALVDDDLDYSPRPIMQSYLTFTSELSRLNAEFLAGPRAPRTILFDVEPIDKNYPSLEDAQSWPELLTRYDLMDASQSRLVLRRADIPRECSLIPLEEVEGVMGHPIRVPSSPDPIWATVRTRLTPLGELMQAVYKVPVLLINVRTRSGNAPFFRLLRNVADEGFLLSPKVEDRMEFATLYSPDWQAKMDGSVVTGIAIGVADGGKSPYYEESYEVEFYALRYPHPDVSAVPGMADYWRRGELPATNTP